MPATGLMIITNKLDFSIHIIDYFQSMNPLNAFNLSLIPIGLDQNESKDELMGEINKNFEKDPKLKMVVIFSDLGSPREIAKEIKSDNPELKLICSNGNLIENAFLTYILLNTRAPVEAIKEVLEKNIRGLI